MIVWFLLLLSPLVSAEDAAKVPVIDAKIPLCGRNEVFGLCPDVCPEPVCERIFFDETDWSCPAIATEKACCRCAVGFYRRGFECVPIFDCCDGPHERLVKHANICPGGTCDKPKRDTTCLIRVPWYACQCDRGFVEISDDDPTCIPLEFCDFFQEEVKKRSTRTK